MEAIKKQRSFFKVTRWEDIVEEEELSDPSIKDIEDSLKTQPPLTESIKKFNEDLMEAKETIQQAKENQAPSLKQLTENNLIISETLAKIYINQGEFLEAISVYEKLISKYPEKTDYYQIKIEEIKIRMNPDEF